METTPRQMGSPRLKAAHKCCWTQHRLQKGHPLCMQVSRTWSVPELAHTQLATQRYEHHKRPAACKKGQACVCAEGVPWIRARKHLSDSCPQHVPKALGRHAPPLFLWVPAWVDPFPIARTLQHESLAPHPTLLNPLPCTLHCLIPCPAPYTA
eukprot:361394-Chlamydomonas_euryale.AAC.5